ncbi:hypothetical protein [Streptomyces nanshensis]|uniref:Uncharacterized protein n=1 Tax=Streptomyces nanshensis TaxID=518642 RepID=A0A1E7LA11_9ACTN|nr:hypothetical protein [Streptomyces nanshensis]OEV12994.1 hypothetical protein AN218_05655 [Streptomyces nanshensis]
MRNERFQEFAVAAYRSAPEVASAEPYRDGTRRPLGIEVRLTSGVTVRHAITMVTPQGEDLEAPEKVVEGEPPALIEPRPAPRGVRDRQTAQLLACILASAGNKEMARAYAYDQTSMHPGLGVEWHSGRKTHMLLL